MLDTTILGMIILVVLLFMGIIHEAFWFLAAFVSFYLVESLNADFPNTLWSLAFVAFGMMLILFTIKRMSSGGERRWPDFGF